MAVLRAALAKVLSPGAPNSEAAWQEALVPTSNASKRRTVYLDKDQRRKLLQHIDDEAAPFARALCLLPLRPGAMASLVARDFEKRTSELTVGKDKAGKGRRIEISAAAAELLTEQSNNKLPTAPLFMCANGKAWNKDSWKLPFASVVAAAELPGKATAYTLRLSTITDLVTAALPLLSIAQIFGTSAEMIARHYGHLARGAAVKALEALALSISGVQECGDAEEVFRRTMFYVVKQHHTGCGFSTSPAKRAAIQHDLAVLVYFRFLKLAEMADFRRFLTENHLRSPLARSLRCLRSMKKEVKPRSSDALATLIPLGGAQH
jgi:hypothetical protein